MAYSIDLYNGTGLTSDERFGGSRSNGDRAFIVTGLTDARNALDLAIGEVRAGEGTTHPDDSSMFLSSISVQHFNTDIAIGVARYRGLAPQVDMTREAKAQTSRRVSRSRIEWWRDTSAFDSDGLPNGDLIFDPAPDDTPDDELIPRSIGFEIGLQTIQMPTVLTSHPATSHVDKVGKINSAIDAQFLEVGAFPAKTLLFNGWNSTYIGHGRWFVVYSVTYNPHGWQRMLPPVYNTGTSAWETTIVDAFESENLSTLPVHA